MTGRDDVEQLASMTEQLRHTVLEKSPGSNGEAFAEMLAKHAEGIRGFASMMPPFNEGELSALVQQYEPAALAESSDADRVLLVLLGRNGDVLSHRVADRLPGPLTAESVKVYFPGTGAETRVSGMQVVDDSRVPGQRVTVVWGVADP